MKIINVGSMDENSISGSYNIPYDELICNYRKYLNKEENYYLYCKSGKLSKRAVMILSSLGYKVYNLKN